MLVVDVAIHAAFLLEDDKVISQLAPNCTAKGVKDVEDMVPNSIRHIFHAVNVEDLAKHTRQARNLDTTTNPVEITFDYHLAGPARFTKCIITCYIQPLLPCQCESDTLYNVLTVTNQLS